MTFLDMIEIYNISKGNENLDDIGSIFADIVIDNRIDKNTMISAILDKCGAMRCIYETTATFKYFSDHFFKKYQWNISRLADTLDFEYNPLQNNKVDWTETTNIKQDLDTVENTSENRDKTNGYNGTETNTISAMNSNDYEPDNRSQNTSSATENIDADKDRSKEEDLTWEETDTHHETGTINTPFQDLIEKERKVSQFNVYNWIAEKYASELFLLVY